MASKKNKADISIVKTVFLTYLILLLHVLLIAAVGALVIFFKGISEYIEWILGTGALIVFASAYYIYYRMKKQSRSLAETLSSPSFAGRNVEISLMGGFASLKIGSEQGMPLIEQAVLPEAKQLEDPTIQRIKELGELARLYENNLLTLDEYNKAKSELMNNL